jgi:hypothetical protein
MRRALPLLMAAITVVALTSCHHESKDALRFTPAILPAGHVGVPYSATITVTNQYTPVGDISVSRGALPAGLTLHYVEIQDSAQISGTPRASGTHVFTISAWCMGTNQPGQTGERSYSLEVLK